MDNKNTIIAISAALILLMLVFACSTKKEPSKPKINFPSTQTTTTNQSSNKEDGYRPSRGSSASSHSGGSYYTDESKAPPAILTEAEKKVMKERRKKQRIKLAKAAEEWLKHKSNDVSLCDNTREKNKIKSHQGFTNGSYAKRNHDYKTAIKCFSDTYKDENATAYTKYFAACNLKDIARETGDFDLYFIAARMEAKLIATEDLSILNIEKSTLEFDWIDKVETSLKAKKDPKAFEALVKMKMDQYGEGCDRQEAEEEAKQDIEYYSEMFKELIQ